MVGGVFIVYSFVSGEFVFRLFVGTFLLSFYYVFGFVLGSVFFVRYCCYLGSDYFLLWGCFM